MRKFLSLLAVLGWMCAWKAHACSCTGPNPVCSVYWTTPVVFHGKVIERTLIPNIIERKLPDGTTQTLVGNGVYVVRFAVAEMFRGDPRVREITVRTNQQSSACGFPFKDGADYVVFTYKNQETSELWTSHCSRTHEVTNAEEDADLMWMRGLATAPPTVRIYGTVGVPEGWNGGSPSIEISGPATRTLTPNSTGQFSADELPPGTYTVATVAPDGLRAWMKPATFSLEAKRCVEIRASFVYDSHIRGRVSDAAGQGVSGLAMELIRKGPSAPSQPPAMFATTAGDGSYDFTGVVPGDYIVLANSLGPSPQSPYPHLYYGGGEESNSAQVLRSEPSSTLDNIDVKMPMAWKSISVPVRVVMPDGSPVVGAYVSAYDESFKGSVVPYMAQLENGVGSVTVFAGRRYSLLSTQNLPDGHQRCGGPVQFTASGEVKEQLVVIEHDWGNCFAKISPRR